MGPSTISTKAILFVLLLLNLFSCRSAKDASTSERPSEWEHLWDTFWASDDLTDVWPILDSLRIDYAKRDRLPKFISPANEIIREAYEYGFFAGARTQLRQIISTTQAAEEKEMVLAPVYYELARSFFFTAQMDSVRHFASEALNRYPKGSSSTWEVYNLLGASYDRQGHYRNAVSNYQTALGLIPREATSTMADLAKVEGNLAVSYTEMGALDKALEAFTNSLKYAQRRGGGSSLPPIETMVNLGSLYDEMGRFEEAKSTYLKAINRIETSEPVDSNNLADVSLNLGLVYRKEGAYDRAITFYRRAESIYKKINPDSPNLVYVYTNLANVAGLRKNYALSVQLHQRALDLNESRSNTLGLADNYTNLGVLYGKMNRWNDALDNFKTSISLRGQVINDDYNNADDYLNLADAYHALGQLDSAETQVNTALDILKELNTTEHPLLTYAYLTKSRLYQSANDRQSAFAWATRALAINHREFADLAPIDIPPTSNYLRYDYYFEALLLRGMAAEDGFDNTPREDLANRHFLAARELLDAVDRELIAQEDRIQLGQFRQRLAAAGIAHAYDQWQNNGADEWAEAAFQYAEIAKAGVLRGSLLGREARDYAGIPTQLQRREDSLRAEIALQRQKLLSLTDPAEVRAAQSRRFSADQALETLMTQYATDYPSYGNLREQEPPVRLKALQFALEDDQAIQSFFTAEDKLYTFLITPDNYLLWTTPLSTRFTRDIIGLRKGITRRLDGVYRAKARGLYQKLFPQQIPDRVKELILVPDGNLLDLPFATLLTEDVEPTTTFDQLPYFIQRYSLSFSPSASLFYTAQTVEKQSDPERWNGLVGFAPVFAQGKSATTLMTTSRAGLRDSPLPATFRELTKIDSIFARKNLPTALYLNGTASEVQLKSSSIFRSRFIHFATHGFVDTDYPELSGLILYPGPGEEDGVLTAGEVSHLRFKAELAVLSACETGQGKAALGEGILGLSRSFLHAGAEQLLVSLWSVQDDATAELMVELYRRLLEEDQTGIAKHLRGTQLSLIEGKRWAHPYFWSPFVLIKG